MRVKIFTASTAEELELEINIWLNHNSYRVARISHSCRQGEYSAMVLYHKIENIA